ncbi:hypothetical protein C7S18_03180 [Ahniella affigens]|uniref:Fibronectin type-III domain-containing protein n=1 Tax=Ahniella affigens TaxID=2021234 RepID=A0A2P1PN29_9GAMM|nr:hypothetical protein C7S18_03180 [Ahniella affigens]
MPLRASHARHQPAHSVTRAVLHGLLWVLPALAQANPPGAPGIGQATPGFSAISVAFSAPGDSGASPIVSYTAQCGTITASGPASPVIVRGLVVGLNYTCTVTASNSSGPGPASAASNTATPLPALAGQVAWSTSVTGNGTLPAKIANGDPLMGRKTVAVDTAGDILIAGAVHSAVSNGYDWKTAKISAATGAILWQQDFDGGWGDDHVYAIAVDASNNVVVVGSTWQQTGEANWQVNKYRASDGQLLWQQSLGGVGRDAAYAVAIATNGDAVVAGVAANGNDVDWQVNQFASADGAVVWTRTLNGKANDQPRVLAIEPGSGDIVIAGKLTTDQVYATTVRLLANGAMRWQQRYASPTATVAPADATVHDLVINADGSVVVGTASLQRPFGTSDLTIWYAFKYAADGEHLWQRPDNLYSSKVYALTSDGAGGTYATGVSTIFDDDTFVTRLNHDGSAAWSRSLGSSNGPYDLPAVSMDAGWAIARDDEGRPIVAGTQRNRTRWAVRKFAGNNQDLLWGGEIASGDTSILHAVAVRGTSVYAYGTSTASAGGQQVLHLKRLHNPPESDVPEPFLFSDGEGEPNTWVHSRPMYARGGAPSVIAGITIPVAITVANGEYSIGCTGTFTSAPGVITNGQSLCLRVLAATNYGGINVVAVTVGGTSATFKSTAKRAATVTVTVTPSLASAVHTISGGLINVTVTGAGPTPTGRVTFNTGHRAGYFANGLDIWSSFCGGLAGATLANGAGSCSFVTIPFPDPDTLTAQYEGDANYQRTVAMPIAYNVARFPLTLTFPDFVERPVGATVSPLVATMNLNPNYLPHYNALYPTQVLYASVTPSVCQYTAPTLTMVGLGTCTINADYAGSTQVAPANATTSFVVKKAQLLIFGALADRPYSPAPILLTATPGATGNPVTFTTNSPAICATSGANGATLTLLTAGTCSVTANQAGDAEYAAATPITQSFAVNRAPQVITFDPIADRALGSPAFALSFSALPSDQPVRFTAPNIQVCTLSRTGNTTVTLLRAGTCVIHADQAESAHYLAAPRVTRSFQVQDDIRALGVTVAGSGSVRSDPAGILCGADCTENYVTGTVVTLVAAPVAGAKFVAWTGCPAPSGIRCSAPMTTARAVTASFRVRGVNDERNDLDGDGHPDLLSRDPAGVLRRLHMNGVTVLSDVVIGTTDLTWQLVGVADFNADAHADLVWKKSSGELVLWYLVAGVFQSQVPWLTLPTGWTVQGVADFNEDATPDLLLRESATGVGRVRLLSGTTTLGEQHLFWMPPAWRVDGIADLDRNGRPAIVFRDGGTASSRGSAFAWRTSWNGTTVALDSASLVMFKVDPDLEIVQATDWNGDDAPDFVFRHRISGDTFVWYIDGVTPGAVAPILGLEPSSELLPRPQP